MKQKSHEKGRTSGPEFSKQTWYAREYCEDIEVFAPLHDIGKVGIMILFACREKTHTRGV
jgi:response regulator RpfG family c-di-GMP phosphodiesterase